MPQSENENLVSGFESKYIKAVANITMIDVTLWNEMN